jgi:primosomal protein N' (replication factor Y)
MVDATVPHLDRPFDYAVPAALETTAQVGARVRVRFAGRLTDGIVVGRTSIAEREGELRPLERVVGIEPVLTADTLPLVREVAARYAGTFSDVVRAAVPPRHARAEGVVVTPCTWTAELADEDRWRPYDAGPALVQRLAAGSPTRAVWSSAPATSWSAEAAVLVRAVLAQPTGGVIVVVPDARDVARMAADLDDARAAGALATLTADQGPERRYREFVRILRGGVRVVVGTRGAVFAPMADLRLIVLWDDGDDSLADPQAPYWDARGVAAVRSHLTGCALVVGSPARSVVSEQWCQTGWARSVQASRATIAATGPVVQALSSEDAARDPAAAAARIPHRAWAAARDALRSGAVLVQVARRGYVPVVACQRCRTVAHCPCGGPLRLSGPGAVPECTWCGALATGWSCPECGGRRLRAVSIGAERTVEEIGRAFPGVPVVASHAGHMVDQVPDEPRIVVATPGAEPWCVGGYRAVLILDALVQLQRPALDATEDAARRWFAAARLAAPKARVVVTAPHALAPVQALVRWDAPWLAARELGEREAAGLPPTTRMAALLGAADDIVEVGAALTVPHRVLGPVPDPVRGDEERQRGLIVVAREHGAELARQLRAITATRSAGWGRAGRAGVVHVRLDPRDL